MLLAIGFFTFHFFLYFKEYCLEAIYLVLAHDVAIFLAELGYAFCETFYSCLGAGFILAADVFNESVGFGFVLGCCIAGGFHLGAVVGYLVGYRLGEERVTGECLVIGGPWRSFCERFASLIIRL